MRMSSPHPGHGKRARAQGPFALRPARGPLGWLEWLRLWWEGLD